MIAMYRIRQEDATASIEDPLGETARKLRASGIPVEKGMRIGIAVGSRGIHALDRICRSVADFLIEQGAVPFIIPAMGSHGGATPEGQREVLAGYGITEETMGIPVAAGMEVEQLDTPGCECRVFLSREALQADGVVLINRVKPHTDFHGRYESGLVKMAVIGLGKHVQAREIHKFGVRGLRELIPVAAGHIFSTGKILAGVAVVENRCDRPVHIEVLHGAAIMENEPRLLELAAGNMPRLPVDTIDVLIVDYIGKDFSGTGLDTNVIGRIRIRGEREPERPSIGSIFIRDISERSHGNALGIGLADVITRRLFDQINFGVMYENAFTSTFLERVKIPVIAENDREGFRFALRCCGSIPVGMERVVRIRNTLRTDEVHVSERVLKDIGHRPDITVIEGPFPLFTTTELSTL